MNGKAIGQLAGANRMHRPPPESGWRRPRSQSPDLLVPILAPPDALLELIEVRRLFEPEATALAATRITDSDLPDIAAQFDEMLAARSNPAKFKACDIAFHRLVAALTGNEALVGLLGEISRRTVDARMWHGPFARNAADTAIAEHAAIQAALFARDPALAHAAALKHVDTTEKWLRRQLAHSAEPAVG